MRVPFSRLGKKLPPAAGDERSYHWIDLTHEDLMQPAIGHPFSDPQWLFEIKFDGFRCLAIKEARDMRLLSRQGRDMGDCFPEILLALARLSHDVALDAELIVLGKDGLPSFYELRKRSVASLERTILRGALDHPATLMVFDLLAIDGRDLRQLPLLERKRELNQLLAEDDSGHLAYVDHVAEKGIDFFHAVDRLHLEGMVAKRAESRYQAGRSRDWLKVKTEIGKDRERRRFESESR